MNSTPDSRSMTIEKLTKGSHGGYRKGAGAKRDPRTDSMIPVIIECLTDNMTLQAIADRLNAEGHATRKGKPLQRNHVYDIIKRRNLCKGMKNMYIPIHFKTEELVPPSVYEKMGDRSLVLIDGLVLQTLDQLRLKLGMCTVNDWCFGGRFEQSGLRTPESKHYSPTSQHSFGRAMDCKFRDHTAEEVRQFVISNKDLFPFITFIENDVEWFHFDVRNGDRLTVWSPKTGKSEIV